MTYITVTVHAVKAASDSISKHILMIAIAIT